MQPSIIKIYITFCRKDIAGDGFLTRPKTVSESMDFLINILIISSLLFCIVWHLSILVIFSPSLKPKPKTIRYTVRQEIIRTNRSVWSKMGVFRWVFGYLKALLLLTRYVLGINKTLKMRYCTKFYLKGHQNYNKSESKVPKKAQILYEVNLDSQKFDCLYFWFPWDRSSYSTSFERSH